MNPLRLAIVAMNHLSDLVRTPRIPEPTSDELLDEVERADDDVLEAAGRLAVATAIKLWKLDVYDPKLADKTGAANTSRAVISEIVRSGFGAGWSWLPPYTGDDVPGRPEWCGMFVARCWSHAIPLAIRRTFFPSTYRLDVWGRYEPYGNTPNTRPATGAERLYCQVDAQGDGLTFLPRAGDIGLVGDGNPAYGDHVVMVEWYDEKRRILHTIEGNGMGVGPTGKRRQGIVRAERPIGKQRGHTYYLRRLIRPGIADLAPF